MVLEVSLYILIMFIMNVAHEYHASMTEKSYLSNFSYVGICANQVSCSQSDSFGRGGEFRWDVLSEDLTVIVSSWLASRTRCQVQETMSTD